MCIRDRVAEGNEVFLLLPVTGISLCVPVEIEESESSPEPVSYTHLPNGDAAAITDKSI